MTCRIYLLHPQNLCDRRQARLLDHKRAYHKRGYAPQGGRVSFPATFNVQQIPHSPQRVLTVPDFLPNAASLRSTFDANFDNPRALGTARFCWDYWHVAGQYTQLRTPAEDYFSEADLEQLQNSLLQFGKDKLGCIGLTPVWLSYYVDGCKQELHCDNKHGPWAFVLSLTHWDARRFSGGETMFLSDLALNFWTNFSPDTVIERSSLVERVAPQFNQLTLFDPRVPHGVEEVRGVHEPREARIVLHGWFVEPEMFVEGAMPYTEAEQGVNAAVDGLLGRVASIVEELSSLRQPEEHSRPEVTGIIVLQIKVQPSGDVESVGVLTDTLVGSPWVGACELSGDDESAACDVDGETHDVENDGTVARIVYRKAAVDVFQEQIFSSQHGPSTITMPVIFE